MLTIKSEHPSSEDQFERKSQNKISPSNKIFEQPEEEFIEFKGEQKIQPNKFSAENIKNVVLTITYEASFSKYFFETKLQAKFNKTDQIFEQSEE